MTRSHSKLSKDPKSRPNVINKDGSLNIHRPRDAWRFFSDMNHRLLAISWPLFFIIVVSIFLFGNLFFAALYFYAGPEALSGIRLDTTFNHFVDCFFFSVQSLNGSFKPVGIWPNILVTIENYLGMLTLVIVTGLFYARFARPQARVIFSENALITPFNGRPCFIFRVANERLNQIIEAHMTLTMTKDETSPEGEQSRRFYNLKLEVDYSPLFALSWTLRHYVDATSPLFGMDAAQMRDAKVAIFASLTGIDDTFSQTITARNVYRYDEIIYNKRFKDILLWEKNKIYIDLKAINDVY